MKPQTRINVHIDGIVQGVGFRPFVHAAAVRLGLAGRVGNDGAGVFIEAEGDHTAVDRLLTRVRREHPPLAQLDRVTVTAQTPTGETGFAIAASRSGGDERAPISPDVATCADCLRELADPADARQGHPFITCTNCGPRFTIVTEVPYDRDNTTMAGFRMCPGCRRQYEDPADRRFHAQPVCCPKCGPRLALTDRDGTPVAGADRPPVAAAAALLRAGRVLAVKGLGGYHLACAATDGSAVATLRARKRRQGKPFAVMVADRAAAARLCALTPADARLLTDVRRPIVLLPMHPDAGLPGAVAPGSRELGLMLPYTPLHHLLLGAVGGPLVMTSGNHSDEPIAHRDDDAVQRLAPIADAFLTHDRPIQVRTDDSVARTFRGRPLLLRRSRGYVPQPLPVPWRFPRPVLACGPELKNTFSLGHRREVICSPHIGDLADYHTLRSYRDGVNHLCRLTGITPELVAHDLHPEYLSTKYAQDLAEVAQPEPTLVGVQHHHAHIAACLADNQQNGPVLGVAFDGLGYGADGTVWGGELLVADLAGYRRAGHLVPVPMPGGTSAIRQPWRMAVAHLDAAYDGDPPADLALPRRHAARWGAVRQLARSGVAPVTSSAGRLFDAAAAIAGVRDTVDYEGQAAVELEHRADPTVTDGYRLPVDDGDPLRLHTADLIRALAEDVRRAAPVPVVAARFHNGVAAAVVTACLRLWERTGLDTVALSGGVFQNLLLLSRTVDGLAAAGFRVLTHSRVPPNDGGVSVGQAVVAAARDHPVR